LMCFVGRDSRVATVTTAGRPLCGRRAVGAAPWPPTEGRPTSVGVVRRLSFVVYRLSFIVYRSSSVLQNPTALRF
jgi:hypothetical protein